MMSNLGDLGSNGYLGIAELAMNLKTCPSSILSVRFRCFRLVRVNCDRQNAISESTLERLLMSERKPETTFGL